SMTWLAGGGQASVSACEKKRTRRREAAGSCLRGSFREWRQCVANGFAPGGTTTGHRAAREFGGESEAFGRLFHLVAGRTDRVEPALDHGPVERLADRGGPGVTDPEFFGGRYAERDP